jgi:hypothetical protein
MPDKYDLAIDILTQNPSRIHDVWSDPEQSDGGCLFMWGNRSSGCLTQIRKDPDIFGGTLPQAAEIAKDERIPQNGYDIRVEHLPVFAEWQRRLDAELGENRSQGKYK